MPIIPTIPTRRKQLKTGGGEYPARTPGCRRFPDCRYRGGGFFFLSKPIFSEENYVNVNVSGIREIQTI